MEKNNESQNVTEEMNNEMQVEFATIIEKAGLGAAANAFVEACGGKDCAVLTIMVRKSEFENGDAVMVGSGFAGNPKDLIKGLAQVLVQEDSEEYGLIQYMIHDAIKIAKLHKMMEKFRKGDIEGALSGMGGMNLLGAILKMGAEKPAEAETDVKSTEDKQ